MPKYKALTLTELESLEKEFVEFLVINGITGPDWAKIKEDDPVQAQKMTELFSDVVWESILRNTQYLDFRSPHSIKCFHCLADKIVLVGVDSSSTDMSLPAFTQLKSDDYPDDLELYTTEKKYKGNRERELFDMLEWGCEISDGSLYKKLCLAL